MRNFWKKLVSRPSRPQPNWPMFDSYAQALEACGGAGYEAADICDVVRQKTLVARGRGNEILTAGMERWLLPFIASSITNPIVVDVGGACGWHYFMLRPWLKKLGIEPQYWIVLENAQMMDTADDLRDGTLEFEYLAGAPSIDILVYSGSLQYVDPPLVHLQATVAHRPKFVFLTRAALLETPEEWITIQRSRLSEQGPGNLPPDAFIEREVLYPLTLIFKASLEAVMTGYQQVAHWDEGPMFQIGETSVHGYGYLWEQI